jgi:hypothetical protein
MELLTSATIVAIQQHWDNINALHNDRRFIHQYAHSLARFMTHDMVYSEFLIRRATDAVSENDTIALMECNKYVNMQHFSLAPEDKTAIADRIHKLVSTSRSKRLFLRRIQRVVVTEYSARISQEIERYSRYITQHGLDINDRTYPEDLYNILHNSI